MELLNNTVAGFQSALQPSSLLWCFIGVNVGTFIGVIPGVGALAAVSILLPLTFYLEPNQALIMLAGIFYGSQYGSSTSSILLNIPGSSAAAATCLDGYPMARQGRAGVALFITTISSFLAGSFGIVLMMGFAPPLAQLARSFTAPDYFSAMLFALIAASTLSSGSALKGFAALLLGLILGMVGIDPNSGMMRFTFGMFELANGVSLVALAMGLFGVSEILVSIAEQRGEERRVHDVSLRAMLPTRQDWRDMVKPTGRGALIGAFLGALPGTGPTVSTFLAYSVERRLAKDPSRFGKGAVEGIAAPEAANNAAVQTAFIPTLSLGIPGDAIMAVLLAAMMIHGIVPGPQFVTNHADLFWALIASFWIGNILLLIINIPLVGVWVKVLQIPNRILYPILLCFIVIGAYSANNNVYDVFLMIGFGILGYFMVRNGYSPALTLLGLVLGPLVEQYFRRSLLLSQGKFEIFVSHPISAVFLILSALLLISTARPLFSAMGQLKRAASRAE